MINEIVMALNVAVEEEVLTKEEQTEAIHYLIACEELRDAANYYRGNWNNPDNGEASQGLSEALDKVNKLRGKR